MHIAFFSGQIDTFRIGNTIDGYKGPFISFTKSQLIKGLDILYMMGMIQDSEEVSQKLDGLKEFVSLTKFNEDYNGAKYAVTIDEKDYLVLISQLHLLLQMDPGKFEALCKDDNIKTITTIPKEHFLYAAYRFFQEYHVLADYSFSDNVRTNFEALKNHSLIDIEALNNHTVTTDTLMNQVTLNEDLRGAILSGMPEDLSPLEKTIYAYIKMCKVLTYDEEYFALGQKGAPTEKHRNVAHISEITPQNNRVVCYEFVLILEKLLAQWNINFTSNYYSREGEAAYGKGHSSLEYRAGKYLISADAVVRILAGDMALAKINEPLTGLKCLNKNEETQKEFAEAMTRMYLIIKAQEQSLDMGDALDIDHILSSYIKSTNKLTPVSMEEKLSILTAKANTMPNKGNVDAISYMLLLMKAIFNKDELVNNAHITIARDNYPQDSTLEAVPVVIFSINAEGFTVNPDATVYYVYGANKELIPMSKAELQDRFNDLAYEYIDPMGPRVDGIKEFDIDLAYEKYEIRGEVRK